MRLRRGARLLAVLVVAGAATELAARSLLFGWLGDRLGERASEVRRPGRVAHPVEDLYWLVGDRLAVRGGASLAPVPDYDPLVGWLGGAIDPAGYRHLDESAVGERRPVLLYGDSYAACVVPAGGCFQDHLERHALGATHAIVNYGVGGFGLDQAVLLFEATAERFAERDPQVVLGVLVDDDLDRCALGYRGWPKPRFERAGASWEARPAAPQRPDPPWTSYALRLGLHGEALADSRLHDALCERAAIEAENRARCEALLARLAEGVRTRGLDAFVVLFFGPASIAAPEHNGWRERFLTDTLDALGLDWVSTRGALTRHAEQSGRAPADYYQANGHLDPLGNQVALRAITEGLQGRFRDAARFEWSPAELAGPVTADRIAAVVLGDEGSAARYEYGFREPFEHTEADRSRLCYRATGEAPTELHYELGGRVNAFEASARFIPLGDLGPGEGSVRLVLRADGERLYERRLERGDGPVPVRVDLSGRERLVIAVDTAGDGERGDWLVLTSPRFR